MILRNTIYGIKCSGICWHFVVGENEDYLFGRNDINFRDDAMEINVYFYFFLKIY